MWRLFKLLAVLIVLGGIGLVGYAYLGPIFFADDFKAPSSTVTEEIILGGDSE